MKYIILVVIGLLVIVSTVPALASPASPPQQSIDFETVAQGEISYYRYGDGNFTGADFCIKDKKTWEWFWSLHTAGLTPVPPPPAINFGKEMVIVTILGYQTSGGGPNIEVADITFSHKPKCLHVLIEDNDTPGPLDIITNPFHIVKLKNQPTASIIFEHQKPGP